jgi:maltose alpha-D-glucosyltransferase/alpha-amylase
VEIPDLPEDAEILWLSAEQSNSSLIAGDLMMIKLLRKIAPGSHPEAEMGRYLTAQGYANTAPFLGEVVRVATDGSRATLAIIQGAVRNQGDAWAWTLDHLARALDDFGVRGGGQMSDDFRFDDFTAFAANLGMRLGELHAVLARPSDNPDFAPAKAGDDEIAVWTRRAQSLLDDAMSALEAKRTWEHEEDGGRAASLVARRGKLSAAIDRLAEAGRGSPVTRIHGDLHLGQILVSSGDAVFIDFEGEPARPLEERRAKASPLRDVAGVLRSFDYAAAMVGRNEQASPHVAGPRRNDFLERFRVDAAQAFLAAYRTSVEASGGAVSMELLDMFLIEKAAYEIAYEASNRPAWIGVPLGGLDGLAQRLAPDDGAKA